MAEETKNDQALQERVSGNWGDINNWYVERGGSSNQQVYRQVIDPATGRVHIFAEGLAYSAHHLTAQMEEKIKVMDELTKTARQMGFTIENENEKILVTLINEKLTEMFGTGKPMEESRKIIMDGVMEQIRRFNNKLSEDFMAELSRQREKMERENAEKIRQMKNEIIEKMLRDFEEVKHQFQHNYENQKKDIIKLRQEFLADLRTL